MSPKVRTELRTCVSGAKFDGQADFEVHLTVAPQKTSKNNKDVKFRSKFLTEKKMFGVEKSNVGDGLKRVLAKFEANRSHPRGVNSRSKFAICLKVFVVVFFVFFGLQRS